MWSSLLPSSREIIACGIFSLTAVLAPGQAPHPEFEHHPDIRLELFAQEPDIVDPVALAFAADGDLFVVEMRDYPYGVGGGGQPGGTIRLLRDTDQDGRSDLSKLFAEDLSFPTSVLPWKKGLLVLAPPEILYLEDRDGDDRADVRRPLIRGLALGVTDGNANSLTWGPDGRVHVANGSNGGALVWLGPGADPEAPPLSIAGADFSFHPEKGELRRTFQTAGGFGLVFDAWGASLTTNNTNYLQQRVVDLRYVEGRPEIPAWDWTENISAHGPAPRVYPIAEAVTRVNHPEQAGHFSSAGGMGWLEGAPFSPSLHQSVFVCDVVSNLVHRDLLEWRGARFHAQRAPEEQEREFLASRNPRFRPIGLEPGPEGALYLIDMHREVIEHPDYIPEKVLKKLDVRAGEDQGRIYRILPADGPALTTHRLDSSSVAELVQALGSTNLWQRRTAHRLLAERGDDSETLEIIRRDGLSAESPQARAASLSLLADEQSLTPSETLKAFEDAHPGVRVTALRLAESAFPKWPAGVDVALNLLADREPRVRFQAALSLSGIDHPKKLDKLASVAKDGEVDRWTGRAWILCAGRESHELLRRLIDAKPSDTEMPFFQELADVAAAGLPEPAAAASLSAWLGEQAEASWPPELATAVFTGLHAGWRRQPDKCPSAEMLQAALDAWAVAGPASLRPALLDLVQVSGARVPAALRKLMTESLVKAKEGSIEDRLEALDILARFDGEESVATLLNCLDAHEPYAVQQRALGALTKIKPPLLGTELVERWPVLSPSLRPEVISVWLGNRAYHDAIVTGLESGRLLFRELNLDLEQRRTLRRWSTPEIQERARKLFGDEEYTNRKDIVETWLAKMPDEGSASKGRVIFTARCATCHRSGDLGVEVGPNLSGVSHRSMEDLLSHILDPNMVIDPNYVACMVETRSEDILLGLLERNDESGVVLTLANGEKRTVPREELVRFSTLQTSLMPEGLEADLSEADMRDLIAFLQNPEE